jgi:hypothetical protein
MLERRILMIALVGILESAMKGSFQTFREGWHVLTYSFSIVHCRGCWF